MWPDGWTAVTSDGKRSAQFEHTLLVSIVHFSSFQQFRIIFGQNPRKIPEVCLAQCPLKYLPFLQLLEGYSGKLWKFWDVILNTQYVWDINIF